MDFLHARYNLNRTNNHLLFKIHFHSDNETAQRVFSSILIERGTLKMQNCGDVSSGNY